MYQHVLDVEKKIIRRCVQNNHVSLDSLQNETFHLLREGCEQLFGRPVSVSEMNRLYPHHVGHWMGMEVHDNSTFSRGHLLKEGMVMTVGSTLSLHL